MMLGDLHGGAIRSRADSGTHGRPDGSRSAGCHATAHLLRPRAPAALAICELAAGPPGAGPSGTSRSMKPKVRMRVDPDAARSATRLRRNISLNVKLENVDDGVSIL